MTKVSSFVKQMFMSIVTVVSFTLSELERFNRVSSIGGGLVGYN